ncbi:hypothetical protein PVA19_11230 [Agrobacterium sp. CNPSo 3708]|uniref:hypothetical protein n=1 Tax=Agrobacterium sp. CNPSo 3708 TaxID=3028150 RepID=UPI002363DFA2|nr:hypothetical protein [Agrobacterium sp. CNPSo 3708]MDD1498984.1 hypothetical protein [Agrobacterium sp. CNPSo 3708]
MKRADGNRLMAENYRNRYAKKLFNPATIATAIDAVAMEGHRQYRVVQELPFDLSETEAAHSLEEWLKEQKFIYTWRPCHLEQDASRPSITAEFPEMCIVW